MPSEKHLDCEPLMLHEMAHILAPGKHDAKWRAKVLEIGGTLDSVFPFLRDYHKKGRGSQP